jgi:hypothetical protein
MAGGNAFTEMVRVVDAVPQLLDIVYVIIEVPTLTPVITPEVNPALATAVVPLTHVPPVTELDSVMPEPTHTADGPLIVPAEADIVTVTFIVDITVPHAPVTV